MNEYGTVYQNYTALLKPNSFTSSNPIFHAFKWANYSTQLLKFINKKNNHVLLKKYSLAIIYETIKYGQFSCRQLIFFIRSFVRLNAANI